MKRSLLSIIGSNILFTLLQPGVVIFVVPYFIIGKDIQALYDPWSVKQIIGSTVFVLGLSLVLYCISLFAIVGKGSLSPIDPTKQLVMVGPYKYSRNPMYVGVLMCLLGISLFFGHSLLMLYTIIIFAVFNIFIQGFEEPRLLKAFGEQYTAYQVEVPRWI